MHSALFDTLWYLMLLKVLTHITDKALPSLGCDIHLMCSLPGQESALSCTQCSVFPRGLAVALKSHGAVLHALLHSTLYLMLLVEYMLQCYLGHCTPDMYVCRWHSAIDVLVSISLQAHTGASVHHSCWCPDTLAAC